MSAGLAKYLETDDNGVALVFFDEVFDLERERSRHRGAPGADHAAFQIIGHAPACTVASEAVVGVVDLRRAVELTNDR